MNPLLIVNQPPRHINKQLIDLLCMINMQAAFGNMNQHPYPDFRERLDWYYFVGDGFIVKLYGGSVINPLII